MSTNSLLLRTLAPENLGSAKEVQFLLEEVSAVNARGSNRAKRNLFDRPVEKTRSFVDEQELPVLHVINFEEGGFISISDDNRANPILAFSETNAFPMGDVYSNGLRIGLHIQKNIFSL